MQNQQGVVKSFGSFRESDYQKQNAGITPDLLFEDSMVKGVLSQLLTEMNVSVEVESAFGDCSNIAQSSALNEDQK